MENDSEPVLVLAEDLEQIDYEVGVRRRLPRIGILVAHGAQHGLPEDVAFGVHRPGQNAAVGLLVRAVAQHQRHLAEQVSEAAARQ